MMRDAIKLMYTRVSAISDRTENVYTSYITTVTTSLRGDLDTVLTLAATPDPTKPAAYNAQRLGAGIKALQERLTAKLNEVIKFNAGGLKDIETDFRDQLNLKPNKYEQHVLNRYASFKTDIEKRDYLAALVEQADGPSLAAIHDAGFAVTGMTKEQTGEYRDMLAAKHKPHLLAEREALEEARKGATDMIAAVANFANELADPSQYEEIERRAEASRKADAAARPQPPAV
jgi:hypothetical protein